MPDARANASLMNGSSTIGSPSPRASVRMPSADLLIVLKLAPRADNRLRLRQRVRLAGVLVVRAHRVAGLTFQRFAVDEVERLGGDDDAGCRPASWARVTSVPMSAAAKVAQVMR